MPTSSTPPAAPTRAQDLLLEAVGIERGVGTYGEPWAILGERTDSLPPDKDDVPEHKWRIFSPLEPGQETLSTYAMLDLILLADAAEIDPTDLADAFGIPYDDMAAFLNTSRGPAPIQAWVDALELSEDDAEHLQRLTDVLLEQYLIAEDVELAYPDHMAYLEATLATVQEQGAQQIEDEDGNILADKAGLFLLMAKMGYRDEVYSEWLSRANAGWD